jgi:hypothetical protein
MPRAQGQFGVLTSSPPGAADLREAEASSRAQGVSNTLSTPVDTRKVWHPNHQPDPTPAVPAPKRTAEPAAPGSPKLDFPKEFILAALEQSIDDSGWAPLATFGSYLNKLQPDFDSRLYGFKKLSDLVKGRADLFVTEERQAASSGQKVLYLRAVPD